MGKAGKSILWFLGACLAFANLVVGAFTRLSENVQSESLLLFAFGSLLLVLATLVALFIRNPAFITAETGHLIPLELIQSIARNSDPQLLAQVIARLPPEAWTVGDAAAGADEVPPEETEVEEGAVDEGDRGAAEDAEAFRHALSGIIEADDRGEG